MTAHRIAMALHGGAVARTHRDYAHEIVHMRGLVEAGRDRLAAGAAAMEVVVETLSALEASGFYLAGRGASPSRDGRYELDASLMDGDTRRAGAVAALEGFQTPAAIARAVMERTPHVILAGRGAGAFAASQGFAPIVEPESWFTRAGADESNSATGLGLPESVALAYGTVGCVVRDAEGRLAAGTSTGGVFNKLPGRIGDSPVIGAGTWADRNVAVSCTGQGEFFLRTAAAAQIAFRMGLTRQSLQDATESVLAEIRDMSGAGGLIAVDAEGGIAMPFVSLGMKRAPLHTDGRIEAAAF
jgi:L-asparaginase/beta-aspartyl-peptidase (threonine type)